MRSIQDFPRYVRAIALFGDGLLCSALLLLCVPAIASPTLLAQEESPPLTQPESDMPEAQVIPVEGFASIRLVNTTNATITYQVVGETGDRPLGGEATQTLEDLPIPVYMVFQRQDGGLLQVTAEATEEAGMLEVTFGATETLEMDKQALEVRENGLVFVN